MTRLTPSRVFLVAMLVLGTALLVFAAVAGAVGQIGYDGCLANDTSQLCGALPFAPLAAPDGLAVRPDGGSLYVAAAGSSVIAHFFITKPGGQLTWDGCLDDDGSLNCGDLPGSPLSGANAVAVSPDGNSLYVASSNGVLHFFIQPGGQLAYDGCLNNDGTQNCGDLPAAPLNAPDGIAVSPDGGSVYVTSHNSDSIAHFFVTKPGGQLSWDGCLNNDGSQNCGELPGDPLSGANGVAVSADGGSVYVASDISDSIAHFFVTKPGGQLTYDKCWGNDTSEGCVDLPFAPLTRAGGVAVSPDGGSVYVTSAGSNSVSHFFVTKPGGELTLDGCLDNDGSQNCGDLPASPLTAANSVAVSPDGESVYVASPGTNSVSQLSVTKPGGQLTWVGCLANDNSQACGDLPASPLTVAFGVAVSPEGGSVYVTAQGANAVAHFFRATGSGSPGGSVSTPGQPGGATTAVAPRFQSARLTNRRFAVDPKGAPETVVSARVKHGTSFVYSLSKAARVLFLIERPAAGRRVGHACRRPSRRNSHARHCTRYTKVGAFAQQAGAAANTTKWSGKLGHHGLRTGRYRVTLTAANPGAPASKPKRLNFTIVKG